MKLNAIVVAYSRGKDTDLAQRATPKNPKGLLDSFENYVG